MLVRLLRFIPEKFRNFYVVCTIVFLAWLVFFDTNDLVSQFQLSAKQSELESTKAFYESKIEEVKEDREGLLRNDLLLEKIAREKYFMKKDNEDVFIVVDE